MTQPVDTEREAYLKVQRDFICRFINEIMRACIKQEDKLEMIKELVNLDDEELDMKTICSMANRIGLQIDLHIVKGKDE